ETLSLLAVREGGVYVDGTTGLGGHSEEIARRMGPSGHLICIDRDIEALEFARARLRPSGRRVSFAHGNYRDLVDICAREGVDRVDGILLDLGISSMQVQRPERGFSFGLEGPLDMRMDQQSGGLTAAEIVNDWNEAELAHAIFTYGEERMARRIARAIVRDRPLRTTLELARCVEQAAGGAR